MAKRVNEAQEPALDESENKATSEVVESTNVHEQNTPVLAQTPEELAVGVSATPQGKSAAMVSDMENGAETSSDPRLAPKTWPVHADYDTMLSFLPTKSAKIRRMNADGYTRAQISKHLGILYQHVRNVLTQIVKRPLGSEMPTSVVTAMSAAINAVHTNAANMAAAEMAETDPEAIDERSHVEAA